VLALMYSKGRMSSSMRPLPAPVERSMPSMPVPAAPSAPMPSK
jgi:hypothetical protein